MKLFSTKNLILSFSCFCFLLFAGNVNAFSTKIETPSIVKNCKDLSQVDSDNYTVRFNNLDQDKRALLNGMIHEAYGKKKLAYTKVHLEIMYKSVESFSSEKTRAHLQTLFRAAGN